MEKIKLLLYCTKRKPYLMNLNTKYFISSDRESLRYIDKRDMKLIALNGKIVAECDFEVEEINDYLVNANTRKRINTILKDTQMYLSWSILYEYEKFYRIHINNLNIFDKPRELSDYCLYPKNIKGIIHFVLEDTPYILLSVSPEEMCRIFNGEQTDLFKTRVLKEML